jgi:4-amino-4-deoxy-L-arabinose transferase-like glycosyltransferase
LLGAAVLLRSVDLAGFPAELHNDEMSCGLEARRFLGGEPPPLFGTGWYAIPNFSFFLASLSMRVAGDSLLGLRAGSVVLGVLSLLGLYLLSRLLFGRSLALWLLALTVPFHWHVHLSRTGHIYIQATFFTVLTLYLFVLAVRTGRAFLFGLAGLSLGLCFQVYDGAKLTPLLLVSWAVALAIAGRSEARPALRGLGVVALVAGAVSVPLLMTYRAAPDLFFYRLSRAWVFSAEAAGHVRDASGTSSPAGILAHHLRQTAGFWFGGSDTSLQYGYHGGFIEPSLLVPFILGLGLALRQLRHPGMSLFLLWQAETLVAGSVLSVDPLFSPHLAGMATAVLFFPALFFDEAWRRLRRTPSPLLRRAGLIGLMAVLVFSWSGNLASYFLIYREERPAGFLEEAARLLVAKPGTKALVNTTGAELGCGHQALQFVSGETRCFDTDPRGYDLERFLAADAAVRPALLLFSTGDPRVSWLRRTHPAAPHGVVVPAPTARSFIWFSLGGRG